MFMQNYGYDKNWYFMSKLLCVFSFAFYIVTKLCLYSLVRLRHKKSLG